MILRTEDIPEAYRQSASRCAVLATDDHLTLDTRSDCFAKLLAVLGSALRRVKSYQPSQPAGEAKSMQSVARRRQQDSGSRGGSGGGCGCGRKKG